MADNEDAVEERWGKEGQGWKPKEPRWACCFVISSRKKGCDDDAETSCRARIYT